MNWIISLLWFWSLFAAVGFIPYEDEPQIRRFAIVMSIAIPVVAFFMMIE